MSTDSPPSASPDARARRVAFTTLGCKVNQSETDLYARQFCAAGFRCVPFEERADVYVVNTCTVTHVADRKSRQLLGQARRANPEALVVATGCYAGIVGDAIADSRTLVIRNRDKDRLLALVLGRLEVQSKPVPSSVDVEKYLSEPGEQVRTRAMVKVQDGCDSHCTYCIIPRARGRSRSLPVEAVVRRVRSLVDEGHAEVVITGVDLGSYGDNDPDLPDLGGLLRVLLQDTAVRRIRVSSLEPGDFNPEWLDLWQSPRLCRHVHVPLQAGSGGVLERMERTYDPPAFADMVEACRAAISGVTITTDVMAGFPGETEAEFAEGLAFIETMRFDGMHVFKYSQRSGTRAARLPDQVPEPVKAARAATLRDVAQRGVERLVARHVGLQAEVVWEAQREEIWRGLTDTNVRVYGAGYLTAGAMTAVRLDHLHQDGLWSVPVLADIPLVSTS